ncbi:hypothetical protein JYB55_24510 [Mycolicibacterium septicum]|nr:hypothetical protein [Mycolicibacterium septicum]
MSASSVATPGKVQFRQVSSAAENGNRQTMSVAILDGALPFETAQLGACAIWMANVGHVTHRALCRFDSDDDHVFPTWSGPLAVVMVAAISGSFGFSDSGGQQMPRHLIGVERDASFGNSRYSNAGKPESDAAGR